MHTTPEFLTLPEAAERLRYSKRHVQDLVYEGVLATIGEGKGLRIVASSLIALEKAALAEAELRRAAHEAKHTRSRVRKGRAS